jgi:hypothetical protein
MDFQIGEALRRARALRIHEFVGCGSFLEYCERVFGYGPRQTQERLRVADALDDLPKMRAALSGGAVRWSAVREMTRVATPENEGLWMERCAEMTVRQIERDVARHDYGADPGDCEDGPEDHVLHVKLSAETWATLQAALETLRGEGCDELDDAFLELARRTLGGPTDEGRASYQIALTVCEECGRTEQHAGGEGVVVDDVARAVAECDGQSLGWTDEPARASQEIPPSVRRMVHHRDKSRCVVPGCRARRFLDCHHLTPREAGGKHTLANLVIVCAGHHRALHRGTLVVEGTIGSLRFRRAHVGGFSGSAWSEVV